MKKITYFLFAMLLLAGCDAPKPEIKGAPQITRNDEGKKAIVHGLIADDTTKLLTKPRKVLLTKYPEHRLTPIFKVSYNKRNNRPYTGTTAFYYNYSGYGESPGNNWNDNFMPGFEAAYGSNWVNISHYNHTTKEERIFFEKPVLIKTLYFPAFTKDTLNNVPVDRTYYMVSVYDEDTNKDGYITIKDLRRFYCFNLDAQDKTNLIPANYSVMSSEYDPANDFMYVTARLDENKNGQMEYEEPNHIFWIDLKNPEHRGIQYKLE